MFHYESLLKKGLFVLPGIQGSEHIATRMLKLSLVVPENQDSIARLIFKKTFLL